MKNKMKFDIYIITVEKNEDYIITIDNRGYEGERRGR